MTGRPVARRVGALLALVTALVLGLAGTASAHASLLSTDPAQGTVLKTAPAQVTLHFSETVVLESDALRVFDPSGKRVDTGTAGHSGNDTSTARVALAPGLGDGTYTVAWRVISADTHPVAGAFTFSVGHTSATANTSAEQPPKDSTAISWLYGAARAVQYGSVALLVGVAALLLLCWPGGIRLRGVQRLLVGGWAGLLVSTIAQLLVRGPYEDATGVGKIFDLTVLQRVLGEHLGTLLVVRVLLLAATGVYLALLLGQPGIAPAPAPSPDPDTGTGTDTDTAGDASNEGTDDATPPAEYDAAAARRLRIGLGASGAVLAIALACTWALADHASVGMQHQLAVPLDVVHILSMSVWLGGLAGLLVGLRRSGPEGIGPAAVNRFSLTAMVSVTALVGTGVYQSWRGVGHWGALTSTEYGRLLLIKIGLVAVILAGAWFSRRWLAAFRLAPAEAATSAADAVPSDAVPSDAVSPDDVSSDDVSPTRPGKDDGEPTTPEPEGEPEAAAEPEPELSAERAAQLARQRAARGAAAARRERDASPARTRLARSVAWEAVFAIAVLIVTTLLTNVATGRSVAAQRTAAAPHPIDITLPYDTGGSTDGAKGKVTIDIDPAKTGTNTVHAYLYDQAGKPVDVPELDLAFALPSQSLGPLPAKLNKLDVGHWASTGLDLPFAGTWTVSVSIRSDAIDETTVSAPAAIG